jgi:hypothetical protein
MRFAYITEVTKHGLTVVGWVFAGYGERVVGEIPV